MRTLTDDQLRPLLRRILPEAMLGMQKVMQRHDLPCDDLYCEFLFPDSNTRHDFTITCHDVVLYAKVAGNDEGKCIVTREDTTATGGKMLCNLPAAGPEDAAIKNCDGFFTLRFYPRHKWQRLGCAIANKSLVPATLAWPRLERAKIVR